MPKDISGPMGKTGCSLALIGAHLLIAKDAPEYLPVFAKSNQADVLKSSYAFSPHLADRPRPIDAPPSTDCHIFVSNEPAVSSRPAILILPGPERPTRVYLARER